MVDLVDERAEAEAVAEEHELVLVLGARLARAREELHRARPLGVRQLRLARERVQVRDERRRELERARVPAQAPVQLLHAVRVRKWGAGRRRDSERNGRGAYWSVMV